MSASGLLAQLLNGLASASSLFLVSVGLSLIFGVTRTINTPTRKSASSWPPRR